MDGPPVHGSPVDGPATAVLLPRTTRWSYASAMPSRPTDDAPSAPAIGLTTADFDTTINGLDVARKKPFPDIFLEAARRLGLDPQKCLVVEDAVNGVKSALAAGCQCLALSTTFSEAELRAAGATRIVPNLAHADLGQLLG